MRVSTKNKTVSLAKCLCIFIFIHVFLIGTFLFHKKINTSCQGNYKHPKCKADCNYDGVTVYRCYSFGIRKSFSTMCTMCLCVFIQCFAMQTIFHFLSSSFMYSSSNKSKTSAIARSCLERGIFSNSTSISLQLFSFSVSVTVNGEWFPLFPFITLLD